MYRIFLFFLFFLFHVSICSSQEFYLGAKYGNNKHSITPAVIFEFKIPGKDYSLNLEPSIIKLKKDSESHLLSNKNNIMSY